MTRMHAGPVLLALVVADPSTGRRELQRALEARADIAVVGQASSVAEVLDLVPSVSPDVILVDLHLTGASGQAVIEGIMASCPRPIMVLSRAGDDATAGALQAALAAGAVEPFVSPSQWTEAMSSRLRHAVRQVSRVSVIGRTRRPVAARPSRSSRDLPVVAIAASTGGPSALAIMLAGLGGLPAPVLVVQHMHAEFGDGLLDWMGRVSALPVSVAADGEIALRGHVYFGSAGHHLRLGAGAVIERTDEPKTLHCPSADVLFKSVADQAGPAGVGVVLTGMGDDGALGLLAMHQRGGQTMGQDERSCAVFGMPQAARRIGAVSRLLPVEELAAAIHRAVAGVLA